MESETWKFGLRSIPVEQYARPTLYYVSSFGRAGSFRLNKAGKEKWRILTLHPTPKGYLQFTVQIRGKFTHHYIHQWVSKLFIGPRPQGLEIDHIDSNKSNNYVSNLNYITHQDNIRKGQLQRKNRSSEYWGVGFDKITIKKKWRAQITIQGKFKHIGHFLTELEAAHAYDKAVIKHNLSSPLNFPQT